MNREFAEKLRRIDRPVLLLAMLVTAIGFFALASASSDIDLPIMRAQTQLGALGLFALVAVTCVPYGRLLRFAPLLYVALVGALALVLAFGPNINGSQRWINILGFQFQPSEPLKPVVILILARLLRYGRELRGVLAVVPTLIVVGVPVVLVAKQPDLGTALMYLPVGAAALFIAGIPWRAVVALGALCLILATIAFFFLHPYQKERIRSTVFRDRLAPYERQREGYQLDQAITAVRGGGFAGQGWRNGAVSQSGKLPERQNDFVFAVISEEFGFVGTSAIIAAYALLVGSIFRVAARTRDPAGRLVASGVGTLIGVQSIVHMGVTMGLVPTTGITLPFVSAGGSSLGTFLFSIGLVLSVSCHPVSTLNERPFAIGSD